MGRKGAECFLLRFVGITVSSPPLSTVHKFDPSGKEYRAEED